MNYRAHVHTTRRAIAHEARAVEWPRFSPRGERIFSLGRVTVKSSVNAIEERPLPRRAVLFGNTRRERSRSLSRRLSFALSRATRDVYLAPFRFIRPRPV